MSDRSRRTFVFSASIIATAAATAQPKPETLQTKPGSLGASLDNWSYLIRPKLEVLPKDKLLPLLKANGAANIDELALTWAKRYPKLTPYEAMAGKVPRMKDYLNLGMSGRVGEPTYEKGPTHDKEPYDKSPDHDKFGFSKT